MTLSRKTDFQPGDYVHVLMRITDVFHRNNGDPLLQLEPCSTVGSEVWTPMHLYWQRLTKHIKLEDMPYDGSE